MLALFREPASSYRDFYDIARFKLAYRVILILALSLFGVSIYFSFNNTTFFLQYFAGFLIAVICLLYLILSKNYKHVSSLLVVLSLPLVLSSVLFVKNIPHIIEPLWLIIIAIFSYINLGRQSGHLTLGVIIGAMVYYFLFLLDDNYLSHVDFSTPQLIGIAIEFTLCMFIIGYFIHHFIETTAHAESRYREANAELTSQNKMIVLQNEEKTVLLQEIHHRVKNNLQVITSLLRLQSREITSDETRAHFQDAINRVMTMSLIHQKMYQEKDLSRIAAEDYFKTLIRDLISSSSITIPVEVDVTAQLTKVGTKTIVPLALLVAELVSNSIKHAFSAEGKVSVFISRDHDSWFTLEYFDNGTWKDPSREDAFGLQLIATLTEQLEGEVERHTTVEGTHYLFRLRNLDV